MIFQYLATFLNILFDLLFFAILARVLMSWMPAGGSSKIRTFLNDVTEPILGPFRKIVPRIGMMDLSPIVAIIALEICRSMVFYLFAYLMTV
ncbi:YggT family protein [Pseudomonadota bacterium]